MVIAKQASQTPSSSHGSISIGVGATQGDVRAQRTLERQWLPAWRGAASTSLPALLQSLFGYDALSAGLVMSPAGFFAVLVMPFVGRALGKGSDARWLLAAGLLAMAVGNYWMSQMNLDVSPGQIVWPRVMLVLGLSMCFAPSNVAAHLYTPPLLRGAAVGLLSLLRNVSLHRRKLPTG